MGDRSAEEVTRLLHAWSDGDESALENLAPLVYAELNRLARRYMAKERPEHTLDATALVHEAYLRLMNVKDLDCRNRAQFMGMCAQLMRRILVDYARSHRAIKRGSGEKKVSLEDSAALSMQCPDLEALNDALNALEAIDARKSRVVELRFFGGLSVEETAAVLNVSSDTVVHDWKLARAWLRRELTRGSCTEP